MPPATPASPTSAPASSSAAGQMSPSPSTAALAGAGGGSGAGAASAGSSRISQSGGGSTARRKVATRPVWARYDAPSPPNSPYTAAVASSADADVPTFSALPPPQDDAPPSASGSGSGSTRTGAVSPSPTRSRAPSHPPPPPKSDADSLSIRSTDDKGPKRFWTFTMPGMRWERQGRSQASGLRVEPTSSNEEEAADSPSAAAAAAVAAAAASQEVATTSNATQKGSGTMNKLSRGWSRPGPSASPAGSGAGQNTQRSHSGSAMPANGGGVNNSGGIQKRRRDKRTTSAAATATTKKAAQGNANESDYSSSSSSSDDDYEEDGRRNEDFVGTAAMRDAAASLGASGLMMPWRKGGATASHGNNGGDVSSGGPASPLSQGASDVDGKSANHHHHHNHHHGGEYGEEQGDSLTRSQQRQRTGDSASEELRITIPASSPVREGGWGMERNDSFTRHQPQTPGWSSPWRPSSIYEAGREGNSIDLGGGYIFSRANGNFVPARYGEKSGAGVAASRDGAEGLSSSGERRKGSRSNGGSGNEKLSALAARRQARKAAIEQFILHNPFVPFFFRIVNLAFTTATLAVAIRLHQILHSEGASAAVGSSPVLAIIISCPTLVHVCSQIYLEYGSKPIGLWSVSSKLTYTMVDLIAISFWSAELSLAFDNYFTSSITCTSFNAAFLQAQGCTSVGESLLSNPGRKGIICRLQGALIGLVFVSLIAYIVVFTVSLFRIFERVSGRRGG